ncbi:MAG: DinB family protein [Herpetosiphonaceae bacterium]|nr:DinB family protein [Herpetosiphonaceae bacterium]
MSNTLARVRAILITTPLRWNQLIEAVPEDLLHAPPAPGEWSALDCLQHLLDTERLVFPVRLEALRRGHGFPDFDPMQQGTGGTDAPAALAASFAQLRARSLTALATVTEDEFGRQGQHAKLGTVNLEQLLHTWAAHDLNHTIQAERAVMQPFIRACGPWHVFFTGNRIDPEKVT